MSAAPGTEALAVEQVHPRPSPEVLAVRHARPVRPAPRPVRRPEASAEPSGAAAWARVLRLTGLTAAGVGAAVALLVALAEPAVRPAAAAVAVAGLVVLHLLAALLRALGDPDRRRAGPLRRVEAGRAVLVLVVLGALLTAGLTALRGWPSLLAVAAGLLAVVLAVRASSSARWAVAAAPLATVASTVAVWWAVAGSLPWRVLPAAVAAGVLVAAVRSTTPSRALVAAPCAAVGVAVAMHALPWPALLVAVTLPAARRAAVAGRPAAAPARLTLLLLLAGLAAALATGTDLPLTAAR